MQLSSSTGTPKAITAKGAAKSRSRTKQPSPPTLHLKDKHLVATPISEDLTAMIATAAYYCAEQRGFKPGHELEDWLRAEQQVRSPYS